MFLSGYVGKLLEFCFSVGGVRCPPGMPPGFFVGNGGNYIYTRFLPRKPRRATKNFPALLSIILVVVVY